MTVTNSKTRRRIKATAPKPASAKVVDTALAAVGPAVMSGSRNERDTNGVVERAALAIASNARHGLPDYDQKLYELNLGRLRDRVKAARIADALRGNKTDEDAYAYGLLVLAARNADGTGDLKAGERRRTKIEEAAYKAAGVYWSRLIKACGIPPAKTASDGNKGKTRKTDGKGDGKGETPKAPTLPKNVLPFIPPAKVESPEQFVTYVQGAMAALLTRCESVNQSLMKRHDKTLPIGITDAIAAAKSAIDTAAKRLG